MTSKQVEQKLKKDGWVIDRTTGGHKIYVKEGRRCIPIPVHGGNRDIGILAERILRQASKNSACS